MTNGHFPPLVSRKQLLLHKRAPGSGCLAALLWAPDVAVIKYRIEKAESKGLVGAQRGSTPGGLR